MKQDSEHLICRIVGVSRSQKLEDVRVIKYVEVGDIDDETGDEFLNRKTMYAGSVYTDAQMLGYRGHLVDIRMSKGKIYAIRELD